MEIVIIIEGIYAIISVDLQLLSVNDNMSDCYGEGDYLQWDIDIQRCTTKLHSNTFDDKQCLSRISSIPQYPLGKWFVPESFLKNELEKLPNVFICNPPKT